MRYPLLLSVLLPAFASAAPARVQPPVERVENSSTYLVRPAIGEVSTAEVGETLYKEGIRTVSKRFKVVLRANAESNMDRGYLLSATMGRQGPMMVRSGSKNPMLCFPARNTGLVGFFGDRNVEGCLVDTTGAQVFDHSTFAGYDRLFSLSSPVPYDVEESETVADSENDFKIEFLYQGMSKGEVKISYREFMKNMARPAFDQDVSYELEPDGTGIIGFKGMRIKVLKATGHDIKYILEQTIPVRASPPAEKPTQKPWYQ